MRSKKRALSEVQDLLYSVEDKWIKGEIAKDTYDRWYAHYSRNILNIQGEIEQLGTSERKGLGILSRNFEKLTDMKFIYEKIGVFGKQKFAKQVFDSICTIKMAYIEHLQCYRFLPVIRW
jgi:site-specific DNA recombinase